MDTCASLYVRSAVGDEHHHIHIVCKPLSKPGLFFAFPWTTGLAAMRYLSRNLLALHALSHYATAANCFPKFLMVPTSAPGPQANNIRELSRYHGDQLYDEYLWRVRSPAGSWYSCMAMLTPSRPCVRSFLPDTGVFHQVSLKVPSNHPVFSRFLSCCIQARFFVLFLRRAIISSDSC